jgi:hypothetical protein
LSACCERVETECPDFTKRLGRFSDYFKVFEANKLAINEMKRIKNESKRMGNDSKRRANEPKRRPNDL